MVGWLTHLPLKKLFWLFAFSFGWSLFALSRRLHYMCYLAILIQMKCLDCVKAAYAEAWLKLGWSGTTNEKNLGVN